MVRYDDGSTVEVDLNGRKADPNLRMPSAALAARWIGQDRQDWAGPGPSVGPDGLQDVRIHLSKLSAKVADQGAPDRGTSRARLGVRHQSETSAECRVFPRPQGPIPGRRVLSADRDLSAQRLKLTIVLRERQARHGDRRRRPVRSEAPDAAGSAARVERASINARWLGQDGGIPPRPGDVHVVFSGLPTTTPIVGAVLSDYGPGCLDLPRQRARPYPRRSGLRAAGVEAPSRSDVRRPFLRSLIATRAATRSRCG